MDETKYMLSEIMTISEAADLYDMNVHTIKNKFKPSIVKQETVDRWVAEGLARQSGKTWLITKKFMEVNFPRQVEKSIQQ